MDLVIGKSAYVVKQLPGKFEVAAIDFLEENLEPHLDEDDGERILLLLALEERGLDILKATSIFFFFFVFLDESRSHGYYK